MRQVILDTETTGLSPKAGHRLTEIGCLEMIDRKLTGEVFHTYLNPEREIDARAAEITGLTLEFLMDKPKFVEIVDGFVDFIDDAELIIHNAPFDVGFLDHELGMVQHPWGTIARNSPIFDTLDLARRKHPGQKNNLDALCKRYNVANDHRTYHGALLDAEILAHVYLAMTSGQTKLQLQTDTIDSSGKQQQTTGVVAQHKRVEYYSALPVIEPTTAELIAHRAMQELIDNGN